MPQPAPIALKNAYYSYLAGVVGAFDVQIRPFWSLLHQQNLRDLGHSVESYIEPIEP